MTEEDPVLASLELAAEHSGDITAEVYQRFYSLCPAALEVMSHVDQHMQGRMLEEVLELLMTPPETLDPGQLSFEIDNHRAYGVAAEQYGPILDAVRDVVREQLGDAWSAAFATAWASRIEALLTRIQSMDAASRSLRTETSASR